MVSDNSGVKWEVGAFLLSSALCSCFSVCHCGDCHVRLMTASHYPCQICNNVAQQQGWMAPACQTPMFCLADGHCVLERPSDSSVLSWTRVWGRHFSLMGQFMDGILIGHSKTTEDLFIFAPGRNMLCSREGRGREREAKPCFCRCQPFFIVWLLTLAKLLRVRPYAENLGFLATVSIGMKSQASVNSGFYILKVWLLFSYLLKQ